MSNKFTNAVLFLHVLVFFTGCVKAPKPVELEAFINVSTDLIQAEDNGGNFTLTILSNFNWSITGATSNCSVEPISGEKDKTTTVNVVIAENSADERSFSLKINAGKASKNISVKQRGKNYAATSNDIKIMEFAIKPKENDGIYSEIVFLRGNGGLEGFDGEHDILYYKANLSSLSASWSTNAKKVVVGSDELVSGQSKQDYRDNVVFRFYAKDNSFKELVIKLKNREESCSGLPILVLTTDDGLDITSKEIWSAGKFKLDPQGNSAIDELSGITEIRGRGNSTWAMPKKPFALKLKDKSTGVFMGMSPHKRWVLLANYADKTGLRNKVAFDISRQVGLAWTPDSRFVDVILNGKFLGNYQLTEHIKIDPNRVDIEEIDNEETNPDKITGGWLFEIDRYYSNGETRYFRPAISQLPVIVKEPEDANSAQMSYIQKYFGDLEKLLYPTLPDGTNYSESFAHLAGVPDSTEYHGLIDINSFINYWIVQELTGNYDGRLPGSVYMHKDVGKKLTIGPVWDFDQTTFLGSKSWLYFDYVPNDGEYTNLGYRSVFFAQLFKDPKFKARAKERWQEVYSDLLGEVTESIDDDYSLIAKSLEINWIDIGEDESQGIWGLNEDDIATGGRNHDKNLKCADAVERLKNYYLQRVNWMNTQINSW